MSHSSNKITLSDREVKVLKYRLGLSDEQRYMSLEEVGRMLGVTRERIRQVEAIALRKLGCESAPNSTADEFRSMVSIQLKNFGVKI